MLLWSYVCKPREQYSLMSHTDCPKYKGEINYRQLRHPIVRLCDTDYTDYTDYMNYTIRTLWPKQTTGTIRTKQTIRTS